MNYSIDNFASLGKFDEFAYRIVYLRPSPYSDERLAVGLVADASDALETKLIASPAAIDLMTLIFGEDGAREFHLAAGELRRLASQSRSVADFEAPTDLLMLGEPLVAYTRDRAGFLTAALAASSTFLRFDATKISERISNTQAALFSDEVLDHVNRLHPFLGAQIFNQQVVVSDESVALPICGQKIFGAPISFAVRDQRMLAEAYVAKFNWIRNHISQTPRMYVLAPSRTVAQTAERLGRSIRELQSIAEAAKVDLGIFSSTGALAEMIIRDEAA
jgi:hypothetical protein